MAGVRAIGAPAHYGAPGTSRIMAAVDEDARTRVLIELTPDRSRVGDVVASLEARHGQDLFGFVRRLGLTDERAEDCVQEVFLRLLAEIGRGTAVADPKAWAYRTVYRLAMDEHRFRRRFAGLVERLGGRLAHAPMPIPQADRIAVWSEVDRLPSRQRQVIYLRYRSDLPFDEIGAVLGMTASAARSHATQATQTLRARLRTDPTDGAR